MKNPPPLGGLHGAEGRWLTHHPMDGANNLRCVQAGHGAQHSAIRAPQWATIRTSPSPANSAATPSTSEPSAYSTEASQSPRSYSMPISSA